MCCSGLAGDLVVVVAVETEAVVEVDSESD